MENLRLTNPLLLQATLLATVAHAKQTRKYSALPYVIHPILVATIVALQTDDLEVIIAALLHDTIEDTYVTEADIVKSFGKRVATLVVELTKTTKPADGNRAARAAIECARLAKVSKEAKLIKLADILHNTESIVKDDPAFAKVYLKEKAALLPVLREGSEVLYSRAQKLIEEANASLV